MVGVRTPRLYAVRGQREGNELIESLSHLRDDLLDVVLVLIGGERNRYAEMIRVVLVAKE